MMDDAVAGCRSARAPRRRAAWFLAWTTLVLVAAFATLVLRERDHAWEVARRTTAGQAGTLQSAIAGVVAQSVASLAGVRDDPQLGSGTTGEALLLRNAMRFDPLSSVLGIVRPGPGGPQVLAVDREGRRLDARRVASVAALLARRASGGLEVEPLGRVAGEGDAWFMPLTLPLDADRPEQGAAFALVPVASLLASARGIALMPGGYVSLLTTDGLRLARYRGAPDDFLANGPPLAPPSMARLRAAARSSAVMTSSLDQREVLLSFERVPGLPLVVTVAAPTAAVTDAWVARAAPAAAATLAAIAAVLVLGWRLRVAMLAHDAHVEARHHLLTHDALTGLMSREGFASKLTERQRGPDAPAAAVLVLDLHRFHEINDTLGHDVGDAVLRAVAARLLAWCGDRPAIVARLGADEFAAWIADARLPGQATAMGEELLAALRAPVHTPSATLEPAATVGIACPDRGGPAGDLLRCAHAAMRQARDALRAVRVHDPDQAVTDGATFALRSAFSHALRERDGGLSLAYQPKVSLADGRLTGVEALARWCDPQHGQVPPARFVPLAEQSELIHAFTAWAIESALAQCAAWRAQGHAVPVAVNISPLNLLDADFAERLKGALARHDVPPALLELELTETALMREPEVTLRRLRAVRDLGVRLSIDDFGTGWASLSYLKRLPVTTLKIDRAFVDGIEHDEANRHIVRATVQLAHAFGVATVAEGVETAEAAHCLVGLGCGVAQGFHFARPMTAEDLAATWLRAPRGGRLHLAGANG